MKYQKEITLVVAVLIIAMVYLEPHILGNLYNNVLGKFALVLAVIFLTLQHTIAGLLAVVFVAVIAASSPGVAMFEGMDSKNSKDSKHSDSKKEGLDVSSAINKALDDKKKDDKKDDKDHKKEDKK